MILANSLAVAKPVDGLLAPWPGFFLLCLYTAAVYVVGSRLLVRSDA
ncbi:hypothetical protein OG963_02010 [Streptomyces sp. NBC_01707]